MYDFIIWIIYVENKSGLSKLNVDMVEFTQLLCNRFCRWFVGIERNRIRNKQNSRHVADKVQLSVSKMEIDFKLGNLILHSIIS